MENVVALALVLIIIAAVENVGMAGAQSAPPSSSCSASLASLAVCLVFLQGGQNNTTPTLGCCTALAFVVNSINAVCLCQLFTTTNNSLGIPINQTRALALPGACKITTPPISQCKSPAVSSPPTAAPTYPTPVASNPIPTAKPPATSAAVPPTTTPTSGGAVSLSTKEGATASAKSGSIMGVRKLIHVVGIMRSLTFIISASSI